MLFAMALIGQC